MTISAIVSFDFRGGRYFRKSTVCRLLNIVHKVNGEKNLTGNSCRRNIFHRPKKMQSKSSTFKSSTTTPACMAGPSFRLQLKRRERNRGSARTLPRPHPRSVPNNTARPYICRGRLAALETKTWETNNHEIMACELSISRHISDLCVSFLAICLDTQAPVHSLNYGQIWAMSNSTQFLYHEQLWIIFPICTFKDQYY